MLLCNIPAYVVLLSENTSTHRLTLVISPLIPGPIRPKLPLSILYLYGPWMHVSSVEVQTTKHSSSSTYQLHPLCLHRIWYQYVRFHTLRCTTKEHAMLQFCTSSLPIPNWVLYSNVLSTTFWSHLWFINKTYTQIFFHPRSSPIYHSYLYKLCHITS